MTFSSTRISRSPVHPLGSLYPPSFYSPLHPPAAPRLPPPPSFLYSPSIRWCGDLDGCYLSRRRFLITSARELCLMALSSSPRRSRRQRLRQSRRETRLFSRLVIFKAGPLPLAIPPRAPSSLGSWCAPAVVGISQRRKLSSASPGARRDRGTELGI